MSYFHVIEDWRVCTQILIIIKLNVLFPKAIEQSGMIGMKKKNYVYLTQHVI